MANTSAQLKAAEEYVRIKMESIFGTSFEKKKLKLITGGEFEFDAVSANESIVAVISTSKLKTSSKNHGVGKVKKILSDALYLLNVNAHFRIMIFTDDEMFKHFIKLQKDKNQLQNNLLIMCIELDVTVQKKVDRARKNASKEMSSIK
jgi:hypothetical protein